MARGKMGSRAALGALAAVLAAALPGFSQERPLDFNERAVELKKTASDKDGIWVLDFHFKDPRVVPVDIPGRGRRLVWYLWYQVANTRTGNPGGQPQRFIPDFIWKCNDEDTAHHDQYLPSAQRVVQKIEDPAGILDIKNSVTISKDPIPFSKEFNDKDERIAWPKMVTGVATWIVPTAEEAANGKQDPHDINRRSTNFTISVYGLSDGYTRVDGPDGKPITQRKTLRLDFKRLGDQSDPNAGQIRFVRYEWVYATSEDPAKEEAKKPETVPAPPGQENGKR